MSGGTDGEQIPFAPPDLTDADVQRVVRVLESGWLTTGTECQALEEELGRRLGGVEVVAVSSCTAAIEVSFAALDLPPGSRVAVPTWTFVSSALAPARLGLTPVLVDVEEPTLNVSADSLARAIDDGIDACVLVHFGGVPVSADVHDLCRSAGIPVIEDAAHALGATDHRGPVAGRGSMSACFSFYATKNLTSAEGGALVTEDAELARFARSYRLHGLSADAWARYLPGARPIYDLITPGIKANLPDMLAALARSQLSRFDDMQAQRRRLASRYRTNLRSVDGLAVVPTAMHAGSADHLMVVRLPANTDRDIVAKRLADRGVATSVHFRPLHQFRWFQQHAKLAPGGLSRADEASDRVLSLPLSSALTEAQVDRVSEALSDALRPPHN